MANSASGESVITRVSRILHAFDADHRELSASELAARAGLSASTAHRLAVGMADEGLLDRIGGGRFRIGLRLWEAGRRGSRYQVMSETALPFMEVVHATLKHNVSLSTLDEDTGEIIYLERLTLNGAREDLTKVALRQPALSVSAGLIMMAYSPDSVRERILSMPWHPSTLRMGVTEMHLRRRLAQARQDGFIHLRGGLVSTLSGLAAPILDDRTRAVGAIAVVQDAADVNPVVQAPVLVSAARGISRMLANRGAL